MKNKKIDLPKNLKTLMQQHKISSQELSKKVGIPSSTFSTYLTSKKAAYSPEHLASLANYFGVTVDFLLFRTTTDLEGLNQLLTEEVFTGWLKVKVERAIPNKKNDQES